MLAWTWATGIDFDMSKNVGSRSWQGEARETWFIAAAAFLVVVGLLSLAERMLPPLARSKEGHAPQGRG